MSDTAVPDDRDPAQTLGIVVQWLSELRLDLLHALIDASSTTDTSLGFDLPTLTSTTTDVIERVDSLLGPLALGEVAELDAHIHRTQRFDRPIPTVIQTRLHPHPARLANS